MILQLGRFANDCYHILRAPTGSRPALLKGLVIPTGKKMGFQVTHFDRRTLNHLYREVFARQHYYFSAGNDAPVILDCGANIGMASLYFKWLYPKSRVLAFEPDPVTFQLLQHNVRTNQLDIETHNCALWDKEEQIDFFVDSRNPGTLLMSADPLRLDGTPVQVSARRLSSFIQGTVDFLKLDVEGAEHRVLCDLVQSKKLPLIRRLVIEYHHRIGGQKSCLGDFLLKLEQAGFQYEICAAVYPLMAVNSYQDVLIGAYQ